MLLSLRSVLAGVIFGRWGQSHFLTMSFAHAHLLVCSAVLPAGAASLRKSSIFVLVYQYFREEDVLVLSAMKTEVFVEVRTAYARFSTNEMALW